jgi:hypothetical protein
MQKGRDAEEHGIRVLRDRSISRIKKAVKYQVSMAQEPQWAECEKGWEKINQEMKGIGLLEFGSPEGFVDLHDIVKRHGEQDSAWEAEITQVVSMALGQIQHFMEHMIKARAVLQWLSSKIIVGP